MDWKDGVFVADQSTAGIIGSIERRACERVFLDLLDKMSKEVELAVRIGIATGPMIVGDQIGEGTASETAVVGETPNLAARLQALAQPNQIVVSAATRAMLGDHFDLEDWGHMSSRGSPSRCRHGASWSRTTSVHLSV